MHRRGAAIVTVILCVAVGAAAFAVPATLAQVPSSPLASDSAVTLGPVNVDGEPLYASVTLSRGWTRIGMGPFLRDDRASLVSPDGAYRALLELVRVARADDAGDAVPGDAAGELESRLASATWSTEALASGSEVRYTTLADGEDTVTVAILDPPDGVLTGSGASSPQRAHLVVVAAAPSADADGYRTVTADLISSAVFSLSHPSGTPTEDVQL
ncbi:hypothetical protein [Naasia sp. SYSU D00948]|uniref:hypothetical protein n=1 Tax=Naasia sp. SYSU D00948 TaxID=2817379 RepID=UPI001B30311C|nr:hypothetical protein [Naasia sp. SYSU D00948]